MSMGDPQFAADSQGLISSTLFASQQPTWKLWRVLLFLYYYITTTICCCSPASCMIGLTKWVHLCAHNSAQCGLQNPLRTNDSTHVQMISPLGTHNPAQSELQHGSHFVQVIGPTSAQSELILQFSLCESYWSHGHTILHKVSSCSSHFVKVVGPMGIQYCTKWIPVVLTLCKWLDPWNHDTSQNGFKISNSCL